MTGGERGGRFVVDASVAIKVFVVETLTAEAEALFAGLAASPAVELHVPELFYSECANILWKYVRRFGYPAASARQDVVALGALAIRPTSTIELVAEALEIALQFEITAYDACYVALAHRLRTPLVTADEALVRKLAGSPHRVEWLGTFPVAPAPPAG